MNKDLLCTHLLCTRGLAALLVWLLLPGALSNPAQAGARHPSPANPAGTSHATGARTAKGILKVTAAPANDDCAGAIVLTPSTACVGTSGTVTDATQSRAPSSCGTRTSSSAYDVWYRFVATGSRFVVTASSGFDGVLEAYDGGPGCGNLLNLGCVDQATTNGSETITLTGLTAGAPYYVRYYPFTTGPTPPANGSFTICVTPPVPAVAITSSASSPTTTNPIPVTVTFSLPVTGFTAADVVVSNGTAGPVSGSGTTYTFSVTPTAGGVVTVDVPANVAQEAGGNGNTAAPQFSITYTAPTVTAITRITPSPTATTTVSYQVVFSASVMGVSASNFSVTSTTGTSVVSGVSGSGTTYTVVVNTGSGSGTLRLDVANSTGLSPTVTNLPFTTGTTYTITKAFTSPVLKVEGTGAGNGTDVTAFVDQVRLVTDGTLTTVSGAVSNGSFETHGALNNIDYGYTPTASPWTFNAGSGIATNGSAFGIGTAPDGAAVAFLQRNGSTNGLIQQALVVPTGTYQVRFLAAQRNTSPSNQLLNVFIKEGTGGPDVFVGSIQPVIGSYTPEFVSSAFTVTNTAPTDLAFSNATVAENLAVNTPVGTLSSTDPASGSTFTYTLVPGAGSNDNSSFNLSGTTLQTSAVFDFEARSSYSIRVRTTNQNGLFFEKTLTITITNVNEAPTAGNDALTVLTNSGVTIVSVLANDTDPDAGTTLTVTAVTQPANGAVTLTAGVLRFTPSAGFGGVTTFTYTVSDGALTATGTVTVQVVPANDECTGALLLTSGPSCVGTSGSVLGATQSRSPSSCSNFRAPAAADVWYRFVATGPTHTVQATSAFDGVLEVFSGSCGSLASLGCSDQHVENSSETFNITTLTAGTTYYVRYYPYSNIPSTSFTICVTAPAPTATITSTATSPTSTSPIPMTVTFSLPVTGFTAADVTVGNGTVGAISGSGTTYTFDVTPGNNGAVTVDVAANAAQDLAGNGNTAASRFSITFAFPTTNWMGAVSNDWFDASNWSAGVPTATTDAIMNFVNGWTPIIYSGTATAHSCTIGTNYFCTLQGGTLNLKGNLTTNGSFSTGSGTQVVLSGTWVQTVGGSQTPSIYNLTVGAAGATLTGNITMLQLLTLNGGLTTGSYKVTLDAAATLSETEASYVTGAVETTRALSAAGFGNSFGGLGLVLTPATGSAALPGSTLVRRVTGTATTGVNGNQGIRRYFVVTPAVDVDLNVTMALSYFDHELPGGLNEARLTFFRSETNGAAGPWGLAGVSTRSVGTNTMTKTGIASLSTWTLGSLDTPLPVELLAFTAERQGEDALLAWATASEKNSASFAVESSLDGREFRAVGQLPGQGTSTQRQDYRFLDKNLARYAAGLVYYRLRQVDQDGTAAYSPVRTLALKEATTLALYPNPAPGGVATLTGALPGTVVTVDDVLGRRATTATADAAGTAALKLPAGLPTGVYVVRAAGQVVRLVVE